MLRICALLSMTVSGPALAQSGPADPAAAFGARESVRSISMSPNGQRVAFVAPQRGQATAVYVANADGTSDSRHVLGSGPNQQISGCEFVSNERLVCTISAMADMQGILVPVSRTVAVDADGRNQRMLGERDTVMQLYARATSGRVIDYLPGSENAVLMAQTFVPEAPSSATLLNRSREGLGVVRLDTTNLRTTMVEEPDLYNVGYLTDGQGQVRIRYRQADRGATGRSAPAITMQYRPANGGNWAPLGRYDTVARTGIWPVAVDPALNAAYLFQPNNGRDALYRLSLDGSARLELVLENPQVDVDGLLRIGRRNRVVGASFANERRETVYFDPELRRLAAQLSRAVPNLPLINFADASEDESRLLVVASSDTNPGRYFVYDKGRGG